MKQGDVVLCIVEASTTERSDMLAKYNLIHWDFVNKGKTYVVASSGCCGARIHLEGFQMGIKPWKSSTISLTCVFCNQELVRDVPIGFPAHHFIKIAAGDDMVEHTANEEMIKHHPVTCE